MSNSNLSLHHCAKRITSMSLDFVVELFKKLNCKECYRKIDERWVMIKQEGNDTIIQFVETDQKVQDIELKKDSHIGFLSKNPEVDIENIRNWVEGKGKIFKSGAWSNREFYFDCPEVFVDFVVEIMCESLIKE